MTAPLLVIVGETASGKTALGIELAKKFNGEIICADSRTVYKYMDIGTAKPTRAEQKKVKHHLLNIIEPNQNYNAARFQQDARELIEDISSRRKLPIMVGGTGLYIDSVIFDYDFAGNTMNSLRSNTVVIGLANNRDELLSRIEKRVDQMIEQGFVDEVKALGKSYGWDSAALKVIGYKQVAAYVRNEISLSEAKQEIIRQTKLFAKRQRTWFKRNKSIHWINNREEAVELVTTQMSKFSV